MEKDALMETPIPSYLRDNYSWAYVSDRALEFWDRPLAIQSVLFGNYHRLADRVVAKIPKGSRVVQLGSCYGNLIPRIAEQAAELTVVDVVAGQLKLAAAKCECRTLLADATASGLPDASADVVVIFFLLHELPRDQKLALLREAYRIAGSSGKVVITEFARPRPWNVFGYVERGIFRLFEPFASEMFEIEWEDGAADHRFGSLYRVIESDLTSAQHAPSHLVRMAALAAAGDAAAGSGVGGAGKVSTLEGHDSMAGAPLTDDTAPAVFC